MIRIAAAVAVALGLLLGGCGDDEPDRADDRTARLLLDFQPNAVHAGIYTARARSFDTAEGVELSVRVPGEGTNAAALLTTGRIDFAVMDIHDLGLAREKGADVVGVMALIERPLAAVLAQPDIKRPRDLEGKSAGVTGLPSDDAVLRSIVEGDGGDVGKVRKVTISFSAVRSLLTRRVAGATAFWNVEGLELRKQRPDVKEFRVDAFGAPRYPELVLVTTRDTLDEDPTFVGSTVRVLRRGYQRTLEDPEGSVSDVVDANPGLDREPLQEQLDAIGPAFRGPGGIGVLDRSVLEQWAAWDVRFGILDKRPDVDAAFAFELE